MGVLRKPTHVPTVWCGPLAKWTSLLHPDMSQSRALFGLGLPACLFWGEV